MEKNKAPTKTQKKRNEGIPQKKNGNKGNSGLKKKKIPRGSSQKNKRTVLEKGGGCKKGSTESSSPGEDASELSLFLGGKNRPAVRQDIRKKGGGVIELGGPKKGNRFSDAGGKRSGVGVKHPTGEDGGVDGRGKRGGDPPEK